MQETEYINVYGARVHNLKDIDAEIPRNSMTVITTRYLPKDSDGILKHFRLMPVTSWVTWNALM